MNYEEMDNYKLWIKIPQHEYDRLLARCDTNKSKTTSISFLNTFLEQPLQVIYKVYSTGDHLYIRDKINKKRYIWLQTSGDEGYCVPPHNFYPDHWCIGRFTLIKN